MMKPTSCVSVRVCCDASAAAHDSAAVRHAGSFVRSYSSQKLPAGKPLVQSLAFTIRAVPPFAERGIDVGFVYVVRKRVKSEAACVICWAQYAASAACDVAPAAPPAPPADAPPVPA